MTNVTIVSQYVRTYGQLYYCVVIINRMIMIFNLMNLFAFNVKTTPLGDFVMNVFQDIFIKRLQNHFNVLSKVIIM